MKLTEARLDANRRNAQLSTGPRTEEGKNRSKLNAFRHGLTAQVVVMPEEDLKRYQTFCQGFFTDWMPANTTETQLVQTLIDTQWRLNRSRANENSLFALGHFGTAADIDPGDPEIHAALTAARMLLDRSRDFDNVSKHEQRLTRIFHSTIKLLSELQAARKKREEDEIEQAADNLQLHEMKKIPYDPRADGFVLTNADINTWLDRKERKYEAKVAKKVRYDEAEFAKAFGT
jgi:hypothetical protein